MFKILLNIGCPIVLIFSVLAIIAAIAQSAAEKEMVRRHDDNDERG